MLCKHGIDDIRQILDRGPRRLVINEHPANRLVVISHENRPQVEAAARTRPSSTLALTGSLKRSSKLKIKSVQAQNRRTELRLIARSSWVLRVNQFSLGACK